ncbi:hypothetical protein D3C85_768730 [compost metagenome]
MGNSLAVGFGGSIKIFVSHRQLAELGLTTHRQWRQAYRFFQYFLGVPGVPFGHQDIRHAVIKRRHHRKHFQRFLIDAFSLRNLTALEQQLAEPGKGPRQRTVSNDAVVETLQRLILIQVAQRIGAVAQAQRRVTDILLAQGNAGVEHFNRFSTVEGLQDWLEQCLALLQTLKALGQTGPVERLGQIRVGFVLQGTEHHGLTGLGSDHDKHTFMADQLLDHQVFEHLLAILLAVAEVEVVQDEVIALLRAQAQRLLAGVGGVHFLDSQLAQHGPDRAAKIGEIIDDQKAFFVPCQHRDSCRIRGGQDEWYQYAAKA